MGVARLHVAGPLVALSVALLGLAACGGGGKSSPAATATLATSAQSTTAAGQTPTVSASTSPVADPIAQPVRKGNFELTMNGITDPYVPDDEAFVAADGDRWLLIDVTLTNTSGEELDYGADYFAVFDTDEFDYGPSSANQPQEFDAGPLAPGDTARGQLAFEVPEDVQLERLVFDPDFDPETEIDIDLP